MNFYGVGAWRSNQRIRGGEGHRGGVIWEGPSGQEWEGGKVGAEGDQDAKGRKSSFSSVNVASCALCFCLSVV